MRHAEVLFGPEGDEVPRSLLHLLDLPDQLTKILFMIDEIDFAGVDDQKRGLIIVEKKVIVGVRERFEIF